LFGLYGVAICNSTIISKFPHSRLQTHRTGCWKQLPTFTSYAVVEEISIWMKDAAGATAAAGIKSQALADFLWIETTVTKPTNLD